MLPLALMEIRIIFSMPKSCHLVADPIAAISLTQLWPRAVFIC